MKKFLIALLALVLIISVFTIAVGADGGVQIVVTADKPTVYPGQTITYTLSVKNSGVAIVNLSFDFSLPAGIEFTATESSDVSGFAYHNINLHPAPGTGNPTVTLSSGSKSGDFTIGTITGTVTNTVEVKTYSFTVSNIVTTQGGGETSDTSGASVTVSHGDKDSSYHNYPLSPTKTVPPTCQEYGKEIYECQTKGCNAIDEKSIAKKEHLWKDTPTWDWGSENPPFDNVTATLTCSGNGGKSHTVEATAKGEKVKSTATCTEPGDTTYAATVTFGTGDEGNGMSYTDTKTVEGVALGHQWPDQADIKVSWTGEAGKQTIEGPVTVMCGNGDKCDSPNGIELEFKYVYTDDTATCTKPGEITATATATATNVPGMTYTFKNTAKTPALGHKWAKDAPTVIWTGDANKEARTIQGEVKATCDNGDKCDGSRKLTFTYSHDGTPATCTEDGDITYSAVGTTEDGHTYNFTDAKQTLTKLGHDFQGNKLLVTWPEEYDGKNPPVVTTVAIECNNGCSEEPIPGKVVSVNKVETDGDWAEPTYQKGGVHTYTVTATFPDGKGNQTAKMTSEKKPYTLSPLEATVEASELPSQADQSAKAKDALEADVKAMLDAALTENSFSGMDEDLKEALQNAQVSTTAGMNVTTALVVTDSTANKGSVTNVDAENVKGYYDIHIDVKVELNGKTTEGHITEVSTPITFTIKLPSGGPIWYVMTNHGGPWAKIEGSKVENGHIVFSSKQFSDFAIISSNDLKDAKIEAIPAQTYTGKAITPKVKVTINGGQELTENEDYTVTYSNNTDKGTATVTIEAVEGSDYIGSNTATFQIKAASSGGSGSGSGNGSGSGSPETGDETPLALYAALLTASLAALAATLLVLHKQRQK